MAEVNDDFSYVAFRYFNVAGNDIDNRVSDYRWREGKPSSCVLKNALGGQTISRSSEPSTTRWTVLAFSYIHVSDINSILPSLEKETVFTTSEPELVAAAMEVIGAMNKESGGLIKDITIAPVKKSDVFYLAVMFTNGRGDRLDSDLRFRRNCTLNMEVVKNMTP